MTIDIYLRPASPPCRAVLMTAKYLNIELNHKLVDLNAKEHLKPEYLKINPQGCIPAIDDNGFKLGESRAIMTYLVNKYSPDSKLYPKDPQARAVVDRMLYFDIGTLYKSVLEYLVPQIAYGHPADPEKQEVFQKALALFEEFLGKTPYAAGDHITLADLSIYAGLGLAELKDYDLSPFPRISAWLKKMKAEIPSNDEINEKALARVREILKTTGRLRVYKDE